MYNRKIPKKNLTDDEYSKNKINKKIKDGDIHPTLDSYHPPPPPPRRVNKGNIK